MEYIESKGKFVRLFDNLIVPIGDDKTLYSGRRYPYVNVNRLIIKDDKISFERERYHIHTWRYLYPSLTTDAHFYARPLVWWIIIKSCHETRMFFKRAIRRMIRPARRYIHNVVERRRKKNRFPKGSRFA